MAEHLVFALAARDEKVADGTEEVDSAENATQVAEQVQRVVDAPLVHDHGIGKRDHNAVVRILIEGDLYVYEILHREETCELVAALKLNSVCIVFEQVLYEL